MIKYKLTKMNFVEYLNKTSGNMSGPLFDDDDDFDDEEYDD